jgi:predicted nucleic acid-binding protein
MTGDGIPANPSVLNTTVLSNSAYIDQLWVVTGLSGICVVPVVREELEDGVGDHLDPGEAQAFALADAEDGRLLTDDEDARSFAKDQGVTVVGSVGILLAAIDAGKIDEPAADEWLSTWVDEIGYYVPYQSISEYR